MIAMFTCTAHSLVSTLESIATPYSVDLEGRQLEHEIQGEAIDVAQDGLIECSCLDLVSAARSRSIITLRPRSRKIRCSMAMAGT